jgi:hypothetical protein
MVGRGTRIFPGKADLLVLDPLWLTDRHSLCSPGCVLSDVPEVAEKMQGKVEADPEGLAVDADLLAEAEAEVCHERETALAAELRKKTAKAQRLVDPVLWASSVGSADILGFVPGPGEGGAPSRAQLDQLEAFGIASHDVASSGLASLLLDRLQARAKAGGASPKAIRKLLSYGFRDPGSMPADKAGKILQRLAANRWRLTPALEREYGL